MPKLDSNLRKELETRIWNIYTASGSEYNNARVALFSDIAQMIEDAIKEANAKLALVEKLAERWESQGEGEWILLSRAAHSIRNMLKDDEDG